MRKARYAMFALFLAICELSSAQTSGDAASGNSETLATLLQQVKALQQETGDLRQKVKELEAGRDSGSPSSASVAGTEPTQASLPSENSSGEESVALHDEHGILWRGFGEANYKVLDQRAPELGTYGFVPGSAGNFYTGDFGLFLTAGISEKVSALAEIDFEEGEAQTYSNPELRRILLKYDYNDHLKMSFGRYQTGIGYYNWAFRSAAWLQTTADRPLTMEFARDGGPLPTQAVGISVGGSIPSGKLGLNYIAEYGSSDTIRPDINGDGLLNDENNGNQINVGLFLTPDGVPGLRIGGSIYHDQISDLVNSAATGQWVGTQGIDGDVPSASARWNQTIVNGHVVYASHGIEFLNEAFLIRHAPIGPGETFNTPAFYSQFSKKIGPVRPFFRYQYINAADGNVIYNDIGLR